MSCGCKLIELCNKWNFWCYLVLFYPKELIWSVSIEPVMAKQIYSSEQLWELGCKLSISSYLFIGLRSSYIQYCDRKMVLPGCFMPLNPHGTTASVSMPLNPPICLLHLWLDFFLCKVGALHFLVGFTGSMWWLSWIHRDYPKAVAPSHWFGWLSDAARSSQSVSCLGGLLLHARETHSLQVRVPPSNLFCILEGKKMPICQATVLYWLQHLCAHSLNSMLVLQGNSPTNPPRTR